MVANFETIRKTEDQASKIIANAYQESQNIKHQAVDEAVQIKEKFLQDIEKEKTLLIKLAEDKANKEAQKILSESEEESRQIRKKLEVNLEKASDFIVERIVSGGSRS